MAPRKKRKRCGQVTQHDEPHWDPLLKLFAEYLVVDFMWMHEVALKDGARLHAYKNRETKRYLHYYREVEISLAYHGGPRSLVATAWGEPA